MSQSLKLTQEIEESEEVDRSACALCLKNAAKYTCPRCNIAYCCVDCYKSEKHMECSETFYKECFMEGLKESTADPEDKQRVIEMLKRAETDPHLNDLDHPEDDLEERLNDLDLDKDSDMIWERLTDQEKKEFQAMAGDGRLGTLVEVWTPWWSTQEPFIEEVRNSEGHEKNVEGAETPNQSDLSQPQKLTKKSKSGISETVKDLSTSKLVIQSEKSKCTVHPESVKPVKLCTEQSDTAKKSTFSKSKHLSDKPKSKKLSDESNGQSNSYDKPKLKSDIANISDLLKTMPSADLKYNVINALYAYAFVCRLHNGEHVTMATESAQDLLEISEVMGQGHSCGSTREAIQACLSRIQSAGLKFESTPEFNLSIIKDVEKMICLSNDNPVISVLLALSDIHHTFKAAHKTCSMSLKSAKTCSAKEALKKEKANLFHSMKKCDFMLSWVQTYGMALTGLVPELEIEYSVLASELMSVNQSKKQLEEEWGGKIKPKKRTLVEEIQ